MVTLVPDRPQRALSIALINCSLSSLIAPPKPPKNHYKLLKTPDRFAPCVDSKSANTDSRSSLTTSIDSSTCSFLLLSLFPKTARFTKVHTNYGKPRTDSHFCRFQVHQYWSQVKADKLYLFH